MCLVDSKSSLYITRPQMAQAHERGYGSQCRAAKCARVRVCVALDERGGAGCGWAWVVQGAWTRPVRY
jgi:hypothetical protein